WEHRDPDHRERYYSVNRSNSRVERMLEFEFSGQRAGSDTHRELVADYARVLERQDCLVSVDRGAAESELPDIRVWTPISFLYWDDLPAAVEVELSAYKKSDEAIMHNFRKHNGR